MRTPSATNGDTLQQALTQLTAIVLDGLRHGFFDCTISSELVAGKKRRLVIRAGKSFQFTVSEEDLPQTRG